MRTRRVLTVAVLTVSLSVVVSTVAAAGAQAEIVAIDPGKKVSAGKPISGSGQNLPTVKATETWDIGSYPASLIQAYYDSGAALRDQVEVTRAARVWARQWARDTCGSTAPAKVRACRVAAVFDIDDTLLSSYSTLSTNSPAFTFSSTTFDAAAAQCTTPVIQPAKELYLALQRMGFATVIITGRAETMREVSAACLEQNGIRGWEKFVLKPVGTTVPASQYKARARRALVEEGWRIGPSIGDQVSDMSYGSLSHGFLMPNPMYLIP